MLPSIQTLSEDFKAVVFEYDVMGHGDVSILIVFFAIFDPSKLRSVDSEQVFLTFEKSLISKSFGFLRSLGSNFELKQSIWQLFGFLPY